MNQFVSNSIQSLKRVTGVDRAIAYTVMSRGLQITGSAGTVILIIRFMNAAEQGYYYTILSLVALQTIFELGFSFVILQMAAHEAVHLNFLPGGDIEGDSAAHSRLASILQKTVYWYLIAGLVMSAILIPLGLVFFTREASASTGINWHGPWTFAVIGTIALFLLNPVFSFLEGCGQICQVARMRMFQGVTAILVPWALIAKHRGLYAPGGVCAGFAVIGFAFLFSRRKVLLSLFHRSTKKHSVSWRLEIWPFQWKIAVTFICTYISAQLFTPILFVYRGPAEAGRIGMSMSIASYLWTIVFAWMSTKATPFGNLIARREFEKLDRIFFVTLKQSLVVLSGLVAICLGVVVVAQQEFPRLAERIVRPSMFVLLLLGSICVLIVQSIAVYLRSHKREPFALQSVLVAALTCGGSLALVPRWGTSGACIAYFVCTGVVGAASATQIFQASRFSRLQRIGASGIGEDINMISRTIHGD
jgi:hypothetical protein